MKTDQKQIKTEKRDFPGKRWLIVVLRTVHTVAVLQFALMLFTVGDVGPSALVLMATGLAMLGIDTWTKPEHLRELAGVGILAKLVLIGLAAWQKEWALPLFWTVVIWSALLSHAPGNFRHWRVF